MAFPHFLTLRISSDRRSNRTLPSLSPATVAQEATLARENGRLPSEPARTRPDSICRSRQNRSLGRFPRATSPGATSNGNVSCCWPRQPGRKKPGISFSPLLSAEASYTCFHMPTCSALMLQDTGNLLRIVFLLYYFGQMSVSHNTASTLIGSHCC